MRRWTCLLIVLLLLTALAGLALAQTNPKRQTPPPASNPANPPLNPVAESSRIKSLAFVGETAPDFELDASDGGKVRLSKLRGYWVLLVFADRRRDLAPLSRIEPGLRDLGVKPFGICADKSHSLASFVQRDSFPITLLSDVTLEISQLYGLHDRLRNSIRPGVTLVDRQGAIRFILFGQSLPPDEILTHVRRAVSGQ